ncbi:hypothetical protein GNP89_05280 [Aliivibrio fischeri]|uniref:hypothetical protein n=1 Tax=Aliivibrio fischeri TaxID=668 RepID=UPI0012D8F8E5|nr:hypothetical protein [Aliivibrio fischeri]MUL01628.1 hypothetical protein [Aliivibrio fischeri]
MVIEKIKRDLCKLKEQGETVVLIENLENYLEDLSLKKDNINEFTIADFNIKAQSTLEQYKEKRAAWRELFKAVISHGQATIKLLATINGGAALALLAFIGKVWDPSFPNSFLGQNITLSLLCLCVGLGFSALTQGAAYIGQDYFTYGNEKCGRILQVITIIIGIISFILFFVGIGYSYIAFGPMS